MAAPAEKRVAEAIEATVQLAAYVDMRQCNDSLQVAWTILGHSVTKALDYDLRLCPSWALLESLSSLRSACVATVRHLVGRDVDEHAILQAALPGPLGGCTLRIPTEATADAAYAATWLTHKDAISEMASAMGRPHGTAVDESEAMAAQARLAQRGILVSENTVAFSPQANEVYSASPWARDCPPGEVFTFRNEEVAAEATGSPSQASATPSISGPGDVLDGEVSRRRLYGRILRGLDALAATSLVSSLPQHRREVMLAAGGAGVGNAWTLVPTETANRCADAQWAMMTRTRLGLGTELPAGLRCQLATRDGDICQQPLDQHLRHPTLCGKGPTHLRAHTAVVSVLRQELEKQEPQ